MSMERTMSIVLTDQEQIAEDATEFGNAHSLSVVLMRFAETKGYIQYD